MRRTVGDCTTRMNGSYKGMEIKNHTLGNGTQIHVSPDHLDRYVTERTFAYSHRDDDDDLDRMRAAVAGTPGRRLTWSALTDHPAPVPVPWRPLARVLP